MAGLKIKPMLSLVRAILFCAKFHKNVKNEMEKGDIASKNLLFWW